MPAIQVLRSRTPGAAYGTDTKTRLDVDIVAITGDITLMFSSLKTWFTCLFLLSNYWEVSSTTIQASDLAAALQKIKPKSSLSVITGTFEIVKALGHELYVVRHGDSGRERFEISRSTFLHMRLPTMNGSSLFIRQVSDSDLKSIPLLLNVEIFDDFPLRKIQGVNNTKYSSYRCVNWDFSSTSFHRKTCYFKNICFDKNIWIFYDNNSTSHASSLMPLIDTTSVTLSMFSQSEESALMFPLTIRPHESKEIPNLLMDPKFAPMIRNLSLVYQSYNAGNIG